MRCAVQKPPQETAFSARVQTESESENSAADVDIWYCCWMLRILYLCYHMYTWSATEQVHCTTEFIYSLSLARSLSTRHGTASHQHHHHQHHTTFSMFLHLCCVVCFCLFRILISLTQVTPHYCSHTHEHTASRDREMQRTMDMSWGEPEPCVPSSSSCIIQHHHILLVRKKRLLLFAR